MNAPVKPQRNAAGDVASVLAAAERDAARRRARRLAVWILALAAIGVAAGSWWTGRSAPSTVYATGPVTRGNLVVTVTATGSLHPINEVEVSSELSGTVRSVLADFNSAVRKGEPLAELDTDNLRMEVDAAKAKLAAARAGVAQAVATVAESRAELDRKAVLVERSVGTSQELGAARAAHDRAVAAQASAEAAVAVAEADLAVAETRLDKACICSPIDGVVLNRTVEPGQTVAASLQAPVLFTIAEDLKHMELRVDVDEADVGRVAAGQIASFTVDAYPARSFPASIRTIRYASETVQGVVTYKAILDVDNADLSLRPGMTATAEIVVARTEGALLVPNQALRWAPEAAAAAVRGGSLLSRLLPRPPSGSQVPAEQDGRTVYVLRDGAPVAVPVEVGGTDGQNTAVSGAVGEGDPVVVDSTVQD